MSGNGKLAMALAMLIAAATLGVAGCGGDDETTSSTTSTTTTTGATGATGASGAEGGDTGGDLTIEDAEQAFADEDIETNDVDKSSLIGIVEPIPDAAISLISPDTGTVAHGSVYEYPSPEEADQAVEKLSKGSDLEYLAVENLVISQDAEPYEGFPTADQMAQILESSG
jgi:hypothetical protein